MKKIKYREWLDHLKQEGAKVIQVRMMSSGNSLTVGKPPAYGIYLANEPSEDEIHERNMAVARSSLGGGHTMTAPIEFFVREAPLLGYIIKRAHAEQYGPNAEYVGYSLSLKGADKVAYNKALQTGRKLASEMGAQVIDKTSEDLSQHSQYKHLKLDERVYDFKNRVKAN